MNFSKLLYWNNGLFLKPHHFQYIQMYIQNLSGKNIELINENNWGVINLEIDLVKFKSLEFEIKKLDCIFKDGSLISYPESAMIPPRSFANQIRHKSTLKCYLGIRKLNELENNVTEIDDSTELNEIKTRYYFDKNRVLTINNLYEDDDKVDLTYIGEYVKIFFDNEINNLMNYDIIQIAEIKNSEGNIYFSKDYIPPCLNIFSNESLEEIINDIYSLMFSYINELEQYKIPLDYQTNNDTISRRILVLNTISEYIPLMKKYLVSKIHPSDIYLSLQQFAAKLSVFTNNINIQTHSDQLLKNYDHENINFIFIKLKKLIFTLFEDLEFGLDKVVDFVFNEGIHYIEQIPKDYFKDAYKFYLAIESENISEVIEKLDIVKIGARKNITQLVAYSINGVTFNRSDNPPAGLPRRKNVIYLELNEDSQEWNEVKYMRDMALVHDDFANENVHLQLIVTDK